MGLALQITSAAIALSAFSLSLLVYVRQQRANAKAEVSVWFEVHGNNTATYMVVKNNGHGHARDIEAKFFDSEGQEWEPRWTSDGPQFPLFPIEALAAGEWIERYYSHVVGTPMPVMTHLTWRDRRPGVQHKQTWSGRRHIHG